MQKQSSAHRVLLGFGIVQIGMSLKSHDASQRTTGFMTFFGTPRALMMLNTKSLILLTTPSGSFAAKAGTVTATRSSRICLIVVSCIFTYQHKGLTEPTPKTNLIPVLALRSSPAFSDFDVKLANLNIIFRFWNFS